MNPILVALDVDTTAQALAAAHTVRGHVGGLKIGKQLFTSEGPTLVRELAARGDRVFLDLKYHDIPNTVAGAVRAATALGVWMVNVHASGGLKMMQAARQAAEEAAGHQDQRPLVIAVTVLTSMDDEALASVGVSRSLAEQVGALAAMAQDAGLDGVVASPQEIGVIRARCGASLSDRHTWHPQRPSHRRRRSGAHVVGRRGHGRRRELSGDWATDSTSVGPWKGRGGDQTLIADCRLTIATNKTGRAEGKPECHRRSSVQASIYFAVITKCPRRFCDQHDSASSVQKGVSLPLLIVRMRSALMPRLTR